MGAAMLAAVACGAYKSVKEAAEAIVTVERDDRAGRRTGGKIRSPLQTVP